MARKNMKEWNVDMPWGKGAVVSWGDAGHPPVLLVHGYMDTAATFLPLLDKLDDKYYYVGFDMPGHGKSDPFPAGSVITQLHVVEVIRRIVEHMRWEFFVYIAHSMGFAIGIFYNHLYPGRITKMIHLDPAPPLSMFYYPQHKLTYWFQYIDDYFTNYDRWNSKNGKSYTHDEAINLLVRSRSLTEEQAAAVLSRSLVPLGDGKYKLSWEPRMKKIATPAISEEILYTMLTQNIPPTLSVESAENRSVSPGREFSEEILTKCKLYVPNFWSVTVPGGHDVHITDPEVVAPHILDFLKSKTKKYDVKSKL